MTTAAFLFVFTSAFCHASWNFLLKRSDHKTAFLFSLGAVSFTVFLGPAVVATRIEGVGARGLMFGVVTALLHGVYGLSLSRGYQMGDLSTVYPISRGMGPALIPLAAVIFLGERASVTAGFGIALVVLGVYAINIEAHSVRTPYAIAIQQLGGGRSSSRSSRKITAASGISTGPIPLDIG